VQMGKITNELWSQIEKETNVRLLHKCGCLAFGDKDNPELISMEENLRQKNYAFEVLSPEQCNKKFPQFTLANNEKALFQLDGGVVYADRALRSLYDGAKKFGAHILENSRVKSIDRSTPKYIVITTERGEVFKTSKLVISAGTWTNDILKMANLSQLPITVTNEQVAYFPPKTNKIDFTTKGNMPVFLNMDTLFFYGLPQVSHGIPGAKIASHGTGPPVHPSARAYDLDYENLSHVQEHVTKHFPYLDKNPVAFARCLYSISKDEKFIIGDHVDDARIFVATGFCGSGFKHGPVVGQTLCKLMKGEKVEYEVEKLSMKRFLNTSKL